MTAPIWLLDFDGVVNALSKRGGTALWTDWHSASIDHPHGETNRRGDVIRLPLLWSDTVVQTIAQAAAAGVDVRWLSTWRGDTKRLLDVITGLPELPWLDESILDFAATDGLDAGARMCSGPWKMEVAKAYVADDAPLLWTEDALSIDMLSESWRLARNGATNFIRPHPTQGLIAKDIAAIREWIADHS